MLTYRVTYAHDNDNETDTEKKYGYATQELQVDHEISTAEELMEIARQIGKAGGYTSVGIVNVEMKVVDEKE